jgi:hypothetical protein
MKRLFTTVSFLAFLSAHDNGTPGWKLDAEGKIVLKDGNPVYINASGQEQTVGGDTISNLNKESKAHRERAEAAEAKLKPFEGIDVEAAKKALETVKNIDAKKLIDAGEVEKVKDQIKKEFTTQLEEKDKTTQTLQQRIDNMLVDGIFSNSTFVRDNIAVPQDMFQAAFRNNFKIEDGKIITYDKSGNRLMSKQRAGEYADPEEALQLLVEMHPQKETILKANPGSGTGNQGGGGNRGTGRVMKRAEFEKLPPAGQADISGKVSKGEMQLVD